MRRYTEVKGMFSYVINTESEFGQFLTVGFEHDYLPVFLIMTLSGQVYDIHLHKPLIRQKTLTSNMSLNYLDLGRARSSWFCQPRPRSS